MGGSWLRPLWKGEREEGRVGVGGWVGEVFETFIQAGYPSPEQGDGHGVWTLDIIWIQPHPWLTSGSCSAR